MPRHCRRRRHHQSIFTTGTSGTLVYPQSMVINGGNDGPLYVDPYNPRFARNNRNLYSDICPTCGKGILLLENQCVQNGNGFALLMLAFAIPCLFCYFLSKEKKCTSCGQLFPNSC